MGGILRGNLSIQIRIYAVLGTLSIRRDEPNNFHYKIII